MPKYIMSDGRAFTDYQPNCVINDYLQKKYEIDDPHQYRHFLQKNSEQVKKELLSCSPFHQIQKHSCPVCKQAMEYKPN